MVMTHTHTITQAQRSVRVETNGQTDGHLAAMANWVVL